MIILKITLVIQIANTSLGWFDFHLSVKIKLREVMTHNKKFFYMLSCIKMTLKQKLPRIKMKTSVECIKDI